MASKIVLHIGLQKSGTTFLQHVLQAGGEALAEAGVLYPVPPDWERGKRTVANHEWPSYGLLGTEFPWVSRERAAEEAGSWKALLDEVNAWPGTVLLSAEALSVVRRPAVDRLMGVLGAGDVEVVVTARSLGRSLPSLWQQHVRNGRSAGFASYLRTLAEQRKAGWERVEAEPALHLWRAFSLSRLVRRWSEAGAARVSVVTTPGRPPELLWRRFAEAAGLPGLDGVPALTGPAGAHRSHRPGDGGALVHERGHPREVVERAERRLGAAGRHGAVPGARRPRRQGRHPARVAEPRRRVERGRPPGAVRDVRADRR
ncbi:hypothetical protein LUX57_26585 [Actinomadura madurae]|uniref:hypothetical protein n=1 Tax=Actinomadura madurae TaxID=1993 RepID=UPI0020D22743|nr:hypothetical protein [Actinomadura madurae]MCP9968292.1 hypothetical protein [Actinomadura madurae]